MEINVATAVFQVQLVDCATPADQSFVGPPVDYPKPTGVTRKTRIGTTSSQKKSARLKVIFLRPTHKNVGTAYGSNWWAYFIGTFFHDNYCDNIYTPPKINMEPKNEGLEDVSPFPRGYFQVPCLFWGV